MPERTEYAPGTPPGSTSAPTSRPPRPSTAALFGWDDDGGRPGRGDRRLRLLHEGRQVVAGYGPQMNPGPPSGPPTSGSPTPTRPRQGRPKAGGTVVVPPMDVMTAGRMAVFQDPQGAFFSVWQPGEHIGCAGRQRARRVQLERAQHPRRRRARRRSTGRCSAGGEVTHEIRRARSAPTPSGSSTARRRRDDAHAADGAGRGADVLARVLRGRRHRGVAGEGAGARRLNGDAADGRCRRSVLAHHRPPGRHIGDHSAGFIGRCMATASPPGHRSQRPRSLSTRVSRMVPVAAGARTVELASRPRGSGGRRRVTTPATGRWCATRI